MVSSTWRCVEFELNIPPRTLNHTDDVLRDKVKNLV